MVKTKVLFRDVKNNSINNIQQGTDRKAAPNSGLAKVAVSLSADIFVVKESSVLHINICGKNRHLRQAANRWVQAKEKPRGELRVYLNHMKNTVGTPRDQWIKVRNAISYPTVIIPLVIGFGSIPFVLYGEPVMVKMIFTALSSVGLGVGINYFTFYLKELTEYKLLKYKGEHTVRVLNKKIERILTQGYLSASDKADITDYLDLIDFWKEYIEFADTSKISYHKRLELEISQETDMNKKKLLETNKSMLEYNWTENGLGVFTIISGSTQYNYEKNE